MVRVIKLGVKRPATHELLPDPEPRKVSYTLISVDDHLMEPPDTFEGRLPSRFQERAPRIVETEEGHQVWVFEDHPLLPGRLHVRRGTAQGRSPLRAGPLRGDAARLLATSTTRIKDMDIGGIHASVNFPSGVTGFGGTLFSEAKDPELGLACTRAWNDWLFEEWHSLISGPHRAARHHFALADPEKGAEEIRRNAKRAASRAVTVPEQPHRLGYAAGLRSSTWEPIIRACAETRRRC